MSRRQRGAIIASGIVVALVVIGVVALVLTTGSSPSALPAATVAPAATARFPSPPRGAVVFAREDLSDVLALAVTNEAHGVSLQASVVGPEGNGVPGLHVSFGVRERAGTRDATASPCSAGCYRATVPLTARPLRVDVRVTRPGRSTTWKVALPAAWPALDATAIVARATRVWTRLHSLSYVDRLGSSASNVLVAHWQIVAPDRLAYQIEHGSQAVIVGLQRWDRPAGGAWARSSSLRLSQPRPFWVSATDAHIVGSGTFDGHAVWRVSFFDPKTPGWFLAAIDKHTTRTLDLHMLAASHFMHDTYGQFDAPIKIVPPTS